MCQDNELSWFDWRLTETNGGMLNFVRQLIALRRRHPALSRRHFLTGNPDPARGTTDVIWHGVQLGQAPWGDPDARFLAFTLASGQPEKEELHVLVNMSDRSERVDLPDSHPRHWHLPMDTSRDSPDDVIARDEQVPWTSPRYLCLPRSVVVLEAR